MRRAGRHWLVSVCVLAVLMSGPLVACLVDDGPSPDEVAVRHATEELLTYVAAEQYAATWGMLHPTYQQLIPKEQLVTCGEQWPPVFSSFELGDVEPVEYLTEELGEVHAWEVVVRFQTTEAFRAEAGTDVPISREFLWTDDNDRWTWFPTMGGLRTFRRSACGGMPWPAGSKDLAEP